MWLVIPRRPLTLAFAVSLKRFFAPEWVFILGMRTTYSSRGALLRLGLGLFLGFRRLLRAFLCRLVRALGCGLLRVFLYRLLSACLRRLLLRLPTACRGSLG